MSNIYLMCGCPAQGKSTWVKTHINHKTDMYVSRNFIRFMLLSDNDEYFSKEKEVLKLFRLNIREVLAHGYNVWVDATFLTKKSRKWIFEIASEYDAEVCAIAFHHSLESCLEWNENRQGREYVPRSVIRKMWDQFEEPILEEGFKYIIMIE